MSKRRSGYLEAVPSEPHSEQDTIPTLESSPSTVEAEGSSEKSVPSGASTPNMPTEPQVIITFGETGIRIVLSDDMATVGGAQLERAYYALMREAQAQRMRLVHQSEEKQDAA